MYLAMKHFRTLTIMTANVNLAAQLMFRTENAILINIINVNEPKYYLDKDRFQRVIHAFQMLSA